MTQQQGICIVAPPADGEANRRVTSAQTAWVDALRRASEARGETATVFRTVFRRSDVRGQPNRSFYVLDPWEAHRLYKAVHQGSDAVFQAGQARVLLDPTKPLESSNSVALMRIVQHKAFFAQFDGATEPDTTFAHLDTWREVNHCESHRDSRVLPLHMFSPSTDWGALETADDRRRFEDVHGGPTHLVDEDSRSWNQTTAWHGNDTLRVGGFALPTGFHWDVTAAKNLSRLASLTATWRFEGRAYLNVSPDGHVRAGQSKGITAVCEGEAPRPAPPAVTKPSKRERERQRRLRQLANRRR